jgi:Fe-S oxidoreductase
MEAIRVLEAFGYRVVMPKADCCGRTSCSAGLLWNAAAQISRSARSVRAAMHEHNAMAVVAVEPSCATAMQQEWTELRTSAPMEAKAVSQAAGTVESFLLEHWDVHPIRPDFKPTTYSVLVHVHCHQKHRASTVEALFRKCGFTSIESLDSGCCGMAGSFGYNRDTYDLSMRIAEQSLGHAMANRRGAIVAAHGTSCRQQLADAFNVKALHPVSLLLGAVQRSWC